MDNNDSNLLKIGDLFALAMDGEISDDQFESLRILLKEDAALRDYYYHLVNLEVSLRDAQEDSAFGEEFSDELYDKELWTALQHREQQAPAIEIPRGRSERELIQTVEYRKEDRVIPKSQMYTVILSLAAVLLIVVGVHFLPSGTVRPVASITGEFGARWRDPQELLPKGTRLWNDGYIYLLDKGILEISFDSGAVVLIEAPARVEVINENEMTFEGMCTAQVPPSAHGFTINTKNSKVVDLGTQFGLRTRDNGAATEVYVLKGKVEVAPAGTSNRVLKQLINAGQGYRIEQSGKIAKVSLQQNTFQWETPSPYEQAVYTTNPINYWRFDRDNQSRLTNEINRGSTQNNAMGFFGRIPGPDLGSSKPNNALWLPGGVLNNTGHALLTDHGEQLMKTGSYSIAMWIRPETVHAQNLSGIQNIIVYSDHEQGTMRRFTNQIYLTKDFRFAFYVATAEPRIPAIEMTEPVQLDTWYHVVATYSTNNAMRLFVNGQLEASTLLLSPPETDNWQGILGCITGDIVPQTEYTKYSFKGAVDEISQYNRELSVQEVHRLYEAAGRP